jgi:hypothetical protein
MMKTVNSINWPNAGNMEVLSLSQRLDIQRMRIVLSLLGEPFHVEWRRVPENAPSSLNVSVYMKIDKVGDEALRGLNLADAFRELTVSIAVRNSDTLRLIVAEECKCDVLSRDSVDFECNLPEQRERLRVEIVTGLGQIKVITIPQAKVRDGSV